MAKNAEVKTKLNEASVEDILNTVSDEQIRADCLETPKMMKQATQAAP